jgi:hypothetical protein
MRSLRLLVVCVLFAGSAIAQSISVISPNYGPNNGSGQATITGTGFVTTPKAVRFVDVNNNDVLSYPQCVSAISCTASPRPGLVLPGVIKTIAVYAMVNGVRSASHQNFIYYGPPVITNVSPNSGPRGSSTPLTITGRGFTSTPTGFPGTTSIYLQTTINDKINGCTTTSSCPFTAPAINDCCVGNGTYDVPVITPGGVAFFQYTYAPPAPATPTITSVTPNHGKRDGGNVVTIHGTNFSTVASKTSFTVYTYGAFPNSVQLFGSCSNSTTCTITMPPGNGRSDIRVVVNAGAAPGSSSATSANTQADDYTYAGMVVTPGYNNTIYTCESGTTATFNEVLTVAPTSNVTVNLLANPIAQIALSSLSLVFTPSNWNIPQVVTITGLENGTVGPNSGGGVGSQATSADLDYNNASGNDQPFNNVDNETAAYLFSQTTLTTTEGGTGKVTVMLSKAPTSSVTLNLTSGDTTEGLVSPATLTFATTPGGANGWNVPRTVTIAGVEDSLDDGNIYYPITVTATTADAAYGALFVPDISVTNNDNEGSALFPVAQGDFNGDGKTDVLLRDPLGNFGMWLMNGTFIASGAFVGSPGDYRVAGIGDFNGDGKADILLRDNSGSVGMWIMNGSLIAGGGFVGSLGGGSTIVGVGDFTGDGKADILTVDAVGSAGMWVMNGSTITSGGLVSALGDNVVVGVKDLNGDGRADVVLRDPLGNIGVWFMNGFAITAGALIGSPGTYSVVAVADFNGDGKGDILLRDGLGNMGLWFMNGSTIAAGASVGSSAGYRVNSTGDYNGDGKADILLRLDLTGDVGMWLMNGATITAGASVGSPGGPTNAVY